MVQVGWHDRWCERDNSHTRWLFDEALHEMIVEGGDLTNSLLSAAIRTPWARARATSSLVCLKQR
jgi:hypothetical protein